MTTMKLIKNIFKLIYSFFTALIVVLAATMAFSVLEGPFGFRIFVVQSGSMEPAIQTGSVVAILPQKEYQVKDVITFLSAPNANLKDPKSTVTHRIVKIQKNKKDVSFVVKGDANNTEDREIIPLKSVLGKVFVNIPKIGYAIAFSKTQVGFILLIIIPATLIVFSELQNIKKEVKKILDSRSKKKEDEKSS
jgi:signal peptidase I